MTEPVKTGAKPDTKTEEPASGHGHMSRHRRKLMGIVVSDKMEKTIVVQVVRRFRHPKYKKYVNERVRYKVHDEKNNAHTGDRVAIIESRPLSKEKRWRLESVLERAQVV